MSLLVTMGTFTGTVLARDPYNTDSSNLAAPSGDDSCGYLISNGGISWVLDPETGEYVTTNELHFKEGQWTGVGNDNNRITSKWEKMPDGRIKLTFRSNLQMPGGESIPEGKLNDATYGTDIVNKDFKGHIINRGQHDVADDAGFIGENSLLKGEQNIRVVKDQNSLKDHVRIESSIILDHPKKNQVISQETSRVVATDNYINDLRSKGKNIMDMSPDQIYNGFRDYMKESKVSSHSSPETFYRMSKKEITTYMALSGAMPRSGGNIGKFDRLEKMNNALNKLVKEGKISGDSKKKILEAMKKDDKNFALKNSTSMDDPARTLNLGIGALIGIPCKDMPKPKPPAPVNPGPPPGEPCGPSSKQKIKGEYYIYSTFPKEIVETEPYINNTFCPDVDNEGWFFWDEKPYGTPLGYKTRNQKDGFLEYMEKDGKGDDLRNSPAKTNAFSTYIEYQPFYEGMNPENGEAVARRLDSDNKVITGLPTYERWSPRFEDKYAPDASRGFGMTKPELGWYTGDHFNKHGIQTNNMGPAYGKNEGKYLYPYNKGMDTIKKTEHPQVTRDFQDRIFIRTPKGRFSVTWLEPELGYNSDGSPRWAVGTNISRRCQEKFDTLVKYGRQIFEDRVYRHYYDWYRVYQNSWRWDDCARVETYYTSSGRRRSYCVGDYLCDGPGGWVYDHRENIKDEGKCSKVIGGAKGEMYAPGELRAKGCIENGYQPPIYEEGREWNYRKYIDTEYRGYIVPNGGDDPSDPNGGETPNPGDPDPNGGDPPGNKLTPYVGDRETEKEKNKTDKEKLEETAKPGRSVIKSGYGVTYDAKVRVYSDWGKKEDQPKVAIVDKQMAKDIGNYNKLNNGMYSQLIRPGKTTRLPVNKSNINSAYTWEKKILPYTKDNIEVIGRAKAPYNVYGPSKSSAPDSEFIRDEIGAVKDGVDLRVGRANEIFVSNSVNQQNRIPVEGGEYKWKQKSGLGIEYGTKMGYFHANEKTKLKDRLIPALSQSRQHFIHVDYGNGPYSVGSMVEIQMFKDPSRRQEEFGGLKQNPVSLAGGGNLIPTVRTRMGNYASITVKGNMYEDTYTAPDNPYLGGRPGGK